MITWLIFVIFIIMVCLILVAYNQYKIWTHINYFYIFVEDVENFTLEITKRMNDTINKDIHNEESD